MALTLSKVAEGSSGNLRWKVLDITGDSAYPTGGESLTAENFGMHTLYAVLSAMADGYTFEYDATNAKLMVYNPLSAHQHNFQIHDRGSTIDGTLALGISANAATAKIQASSTSVALTGSNNPVLNNTVAAGSEVANGTDLSGVSVRVMAFGV
jgi:hypothetical protein